jgi:hypothetical protein
VPPEEGSGRTLQVITQTREVKKKSTIDIRDG